MERLDFQPIIYKGLCKLKIGNQITVEECSIFFNLEQPHVILRNYGNMAETIPLDPTLLKRASEPPYDYIYLGIVQGDAPLEN